MKRSTNTTNDEKVSIAHLKKQKLKTFTFQRSIPTLPSTKPVEQIVKSVVEQIEPSVEQNVEKRDDKTSMDVMMQRANDLDALAKQRQQKEEASAEPPRSPTKKSKKIKEKRVAPRPRFADSTMRCVFDDASTLSTALLRLGTLGTDITLDFAPSSSPAGLSVRQMDKSGCLMAEFTVPRDVFLHYYVRDARCIPLFYEQVAGFAKACAHQHTLAFTEVPKYRDRLCARMHSDRVDRLRIFDVRDASALESVPMCPYRKWEYPVCVTMSAATFAEEIKVCLDNKAASCIITVTHHNRTGGPENAICFTALAEGGDGSQTTDNIIEVTNVERRRSKSSDATAGQLLSVYESRFVLEFLKLAGGFKDVADTVQVHFGLEAHPIWLHFIVREAVKLDDGSIKIPESAIDVIIAPKV